MKRIKSVTTVLTETKKQGKATNKNKHKFGTIRSSRSESKGLKNWLEENEG